MNCQSNLLKTTVFLAAAALWAGSAAAAPLPLRRHDGAVAPPSQPLADETDPAELAPNLRRQLVDYSANVAPGTVIIDTAHTYLYFVLGDGRAIRYGIGVGRQGFTWSGVERVTRKAEWPDWYPPAEMIARQPYLARFTAGGEGNPLGARAIYLGNTDVPNSRHQHAGDDRHQRIERLHPPAECGRDRSVQPRQRRHENHRAAQSRRRCDHRRACARVFAAGLHDAPHLLSNSAQDLLSRPADTHVDNLTKEFFMRSILKTGMLVAMLAAMPIAAQAGTLEGVAIGAGTGAVIAGPIGAVAGGVIGGVVGGPDIVDHHRYRHCWTGHDGYRHCGWR